MQTVHDGADGGVSASTDIVASVPVRSLRTTLRGLLTVVAPTTLVVGLLYYFGWARTSAQAHALGLDDSLFGYSTQDYILRSISSMYWPLFIGAIAVLVGLLFHAAISAWLGVGTLDASRLRRARMLSGGLALTGLLLLVLGILGERVEYPSRFVSLGAPVSVTLSIVLLAYAAHVFARSTPKLGAGALGQEARPLVPFAWSLVIVLLFLSLFWSVSHYAGVRGVDLAIEAERRLAFQPSVTIYSAKRLYLQPPVVETKLSATNSAYLYEYTGLKLLFRSGHNYFLRPSDSSDSRNIVIAESPDLRFEFSR
jgi:hypothetical protein